MGFIFRTIFWLSLAVVAVPPSARLGGQDTADFRNVDLEQEFHNAAFAAWAWTAQASVSCDANPQLCHAATGLWDTTWKTVGNLAVYAPKDTTAKSADTRLASAKSDAKVR
jgi:hypothetical protein